MYIIIMYLEHYLYFYNNSIYKCEKKIISDIIGSIKKECFLNETKNKKIIKSELVYYSIIIST